MTSTLRRALNHSSDSPSVQHSFPEIIRYCQTKRTMANRLCNSTALDCLLALCVSQCGKMTATEQKR